MKHICAFSNWNEMGNWYSTLIAGPLDASPELKQAVAGLATNEPTTLAKMQAIGQFVQRNIRYVAIELGIGGYQPHPAPEVFSHRYGDCKDKATLVIAMLHEIGIDSYYVIINAHRGVVTADTPTYNAFNHVIVAIHLPATVNDPTLLATMQHPKYGRLLFFDPTDELTPLGQIGSYLQASYDLLVTPTGGELVQVPTLPADTNSVQRVAKLALDASGTLRGEVTESRTGDGAQFERRTLLDIVDNNEQIKPIEELLVGSLPNFRITHVSIQNLHKMDSAFRI